MAFSSGDTPKSIRNLTTQIHSELIYIIIHINSKTTTTKTTIIMHAAGFYFSYRLGKIS